MNEEMREWFRDRNEKVSDDSAAPLLPVFIMVTV